MIYKKSDGIGSWGIAASANANMTQLIEDIRLTSRLAPVQLLTARVATVRAVTVRNATGLIKTGVQEHNIAY